MTTVNYSSNPSLNKVVGKAADSIVLCYEPNLFVVLSTRDRGNRGLGKFRKVRELFVDKDSRVYAGFKTLDESGGGTYYQYAKVGILKKPFDRRGTSLQ